MAAATKLLVLAVDDGEGFLSYEEWKVTMNLKMPHYKNLGSVWIPLIIKN